MKAYRNIVVLLVFGFMPLVASGFQGKLNFRHFTVEDGLPTSEIYHLNQGKRKFIWIGTPHGVAKFDGKYFKTFTVQDGLTNNDVWSIQEAPPGHMRFISHSKTIDGYNGDSIDHFSLLQQKDIGKINYINWWERDSSLWLSGQKGLYRFKSGNIKHYNHVNSPVSKANSKCSNLYASKKAVWILNDTNVIKRKNGEFKIVDFPSIEQFTPYPRLMLTHKKIILFDNNNIFFIEDDTLDYQGRIEDDFRIYRPLFVDNQFWLFSQYDGVRIYNREMKLIKELDQFKNNIITSAIVDHENNIWIGTLNDGLYMINEERRNAKILNEQNGLSSNHINCINLLNDSLIYMGSKDGHISLIVNNRVKNHLLSYRGYSTTKSIRTIQASPKGGILAGANNGLFYIPSSNIDKEKPSSHSKEDYWATDNKRFNLKAIKCINKNNVNDKFLIGNFGGLYELDFTETNKGISDVKIKRLLDHRVQTLATYKDTVWTGNYSGIQQYIIDSSGTLQLVNKYFSNYKISDIQVGPNGVIWVATDGRGIKVHNKGKWIDIDYFKGVITKQLLIDSNKIIWIATNQGLIQLKVKSLSDLDYQIQEHSHQSFLPINEVNDIATISKQLLIATTEGLVSINKNKISSNKYPQIPIYIREVRVGDSTLDLSKPLSIPYTGNNISISYSGVHFQHPKALQYRYKLKDKRQWQYTTEDVIQFSSLEPGKYKFRIQARIEEGTWSKDPAVYSFTVKPPFYQKPFFIGSTSFGGLGLLILVIALRFKQIKNREKQKAYYEKKLSEFELKAIENQMNPHFIYNVLNSIQSLILNNKLEETNTYITRFGKLLRLVLDSSRKEMTTLQDEINLLQNYLELESMRFDDQIDYHIDIEKQIDPIHLEIPPFFIQPFVENALKHGFTEGNEKINIEINIFTNNNNLVCQIIDNGSGINKNPLHTQEEKGNEMITSHGINLIREKSEILKETKDLKIDMQIVNMKDIDPKRNGTKAELTFPLNYRA